MFLASSMVMTSAFSARDRGTILATHADLMEKDHGLQTRATDEPLFISVGWLGTALAGVASTLQPSRRAAGRRRGWRIPWGRRHDHKARRRFLLRSTLCSGSGGCARIGRG